MGRSYHYKRPVYDKETIKGWMEAEGRSKEFSRKHSKETVKEYEVAGFVVRCIQRKYDTCMKKENEYGIQVWFQKPEEVPVEDLAESCFYNEWFNNPEEANKKFKEVETMLK